MKQLRIIGLSLFLLVGMLAGGISIPALSGEADAATVTTYTTTANLNLRKSASTSSSVILTIPKGKKITYVSTSGSWYKVKYSSKTGYVSSKYVKKTTTTTSTAIKKTKFKTTANVNLRSKASTSGSVLTTIPKGKIVTATAKSGSWYKVTYGSKTGWVKSTYVKEYYKYTTTAKTLYKTTKTATLRSTPDTKKASVYSITADNVFQSTQKVVNSIGETWYRVSYKSKNYFVQSTFVTKVTASSFSKLTYKANTASALYSYAGSKHTKLTTVPKGATISTTYRIGNWYKTTYGGKTGYVWIKNFSKVTASSDSGSTSGSGSTGSTNTTPPDLPSGTTITKVNYVTTSNLNLRASDSSSSTLLGTVPEGTTLSTTYKTSNGWFQVTYSGKTGFVSGNYLVTEANAAKIKSYESNQDSYLFLDLRKKSSVTADQINAYIAKSATSSNSVLHGQGATIIAAAEKYGVNALYLAAHAIHESNYGKSTISMAKNNLFGFGAYDLAPFVGAVKYSTIKSNIEFIAQEMKATYLNPSNWKYKGAYLGYTIKNVNGTRIDSLSKGMNFYYASDSNWGNAIASHMTGMLSYSNEGAKNQAANTTVPSRPAYPSGKDVFPTGIIAVAKANISLYSTKGSTSTVAATIPKGATFNLLEKWNDYWLTVKYNGKTYYTNKISLSSYNNYMSVKNLARVTASSLNVRSSASTTGTIVGTLDKFEYVELVVNSSNTPVTSGSWYKVKLEDGTIGWCSSTYLIRELNK